MDHELVIVEAAAPEERAAIVAGLVEFNGRIGGPQNAQDLGILIHDTAGITVGGLLGRSTYAWLFVELLFVPDALRGQGVGTRLIQGAEAAVRQRNCVGIWLDTFSFQARGFYEKLGFSVFGELEGHPPGGAHYFLKKTLG